MTADEIKRLTLIGAPRHLNMLTGQDRADMLAFGRACVMAERERCAALCESRHLNGNYKYDTRHDCADAIRAGG